MAILLEIDTRTNHVRRWVALPGDVRVTHEAPTWQGQPVTEEHVYTMLHTPPACFKVAA